MKSEIVRWKFLRLSVSHVLNVTLIYREKYNFKTISFMLWVDIDIVEGITNAMRNELKYSNEIHRARRWLWIAFYRMAAGKGQMSVVNGLCESQSGTRQSPLDCLKFVYETKDRRISSEIREREIVQIKKKRAIFYSWFIHRLVFGLSHQDYRLR